MKIIKLDIQLTTFLLMTININELKPLYWKIKTFINQNYNPETCIFIYLFINLSRNEIAWKFGFAKYLLQNKIYEAKVAKKVQLMVKQTTGL